MLKLGPVPWKVDVDIHPSLILHHVGESDPVLEQAPEFEDGWRQTGRQARLLKRTAQFDLMSNAGGRNADPFQQIRNSQRFRRPLGAAESFQI